MRQIRLVAYFLIGFFFAFVSAFAFAARNCPPDTPRYMSGSRLFSSPDEACAAMVTGYSNIAPYLKAPGMWKCAQGFYSDSHADVVLMNFCSDLSNPDINGMCECPDPCKAKAGMFDNGGNPQIVQLPGGGAVYSGAAVGGKIPATICINNCKADPRAGYDFSGGVMASGLYELMGNPQYTGKSCGSDPSVDPAYSTSPKNSPEYNCVSSGQGFGYVNGTVLCTGAIKQTDASGKSNVTTKTNSDGTKTETSTNSVVSCNGAGACTTTTTTNTTTINADGSRGATKTDVTKSDSAGGGSTTGNSGLDKSDPFCVSNPNSPMCKSGSFSGGCGAGAGAPACEGDPVQCATAKAVFEHNCKSMSPGDPVDNEGPVGSKKVNVGSIVPDNFLPSDGSCIADKVFTIQGRQYVWKMSLLCDYAHGIRPAVIAIAWLAALYIVFGRGTSNNA